MSATTSEIALPADVSVRGVGWRTRLSGPGLVIPAVAITVGFSLIPLAYLVLISLTHKSDYFFGKRDFNLDNYRLVFNRYRLNVVTTLRLGFLSSVLTLVCGYPFAYILIRVKKAYYIKRNMKRKKIKLETPKHMTNQNLY